MNDDDCCVCLRAYEIQLTIRHKECKRFFFITKSNPLERIMMNIDFRINIRNIWECVRFFFARFYAAHTKKSKIKIKPIFFSCRHFCLNRFVNLLVLLYYCHLIGLSVFEFRPCLYTSYHSERAWIRNVHTKSENYIAKIIAIQSAKCYRKCFKYRI